MTVLPAATLWQRDMVRFLRSPFRVVGALGTPLLLWFMLGSGADKAFTLAPAAADPRREPVGFAVTTPPVESVSGGTGYLAYFLPGAVVMIVLFTAIFSVITVIEDRRAGFLQGVLASPAPRRAIVLGKVLAGASLAAAQGLVLLALWPLIGPFTGLASLVHAAAAMLVTGAMLSALALALAWPMRSTASFHAAMNLLLFPMWFLSGAVFPVATAPPWMAAVMRLNPLTYAYDWLSAALHRQPVAGPALVTTALAAAAFVLALLVVSRTPAR